MKFITSLSKVLVLASAFYLSQNKLVAQGPSTVLPSSCISSPESVTLTQPNNTTITVVGKGNINNHRAETTDGYTVVKNSNGVYEYASRVNGNLIPSGVASSNPTNRSAVELAFLAGNSKSLQSNPHPLKGSILSQVVSQVQNKTFPTTGNIRVLALLIDYPDLQSVLPKSDFDSLLYGTNYRSGDGSFKTFYETSSGGQLTVTVDVKGWYRADSSYIWYGRDSGYVRASNLVREAVDAAEVAGTNYSLYDNDSDGSVDGILAIHSGPGAEIGSQTQYIWSHRWVLNNFQPGFSGSAFYDGVSINDYMINPETRSATNNSISGIGVFCHEFGHNLGLPDLYDTDNTNGDSEGIGNWCLMAGGAYSGGSNRPSGFSAWCKEDLGWDTPQMLTLGQTGIYSLAPASTTPDEFFRINTPLSNEYFLIENRQLLARDSDLPGHGLAIWHINTTKTNSSGNRVNADENLKGVDLEEADGNNDLDNEVNRGDAGDLFPGTSTRTTFDDLTNPSAQNYLLGNTGLQIRNIVETVGGSVSFDFGQVPGPPCSVSTTLTANTGSFDDGSGAGLDYVNNQTCAWLITPTAGTVTLSFSAFDIEAINDTVTVYDGMNLTAPLIGRFSGNAIPANLTSSGNAMYVQFKSNATITGPGFDASYITNSISTPCSGSTTLTAANDNFSDGSGLSNYNNNQNCSWLIQPVGAASITFGLTSLATEIGADRITVYDGPSAASPILGSFSGTNSLNTFTSSTGSIFVTFITNGSITDQGFDAFYTSTTTSAGCSGATTLTAISGSFSDGSTTNNYNNNQFCSWLIQPPSGTITLSFSAFATESGSDRVLVFDGVDNTAPQIGNFSGSSIPANLTSTSNSLYLEFRTNGTVTDAGWDASYVTSTACSGTTTLTAASDNFTDGSGTSNYNNNQNCSWLIQPAGAASITFGLTSLATEIGADIITIYDGPTAASPVLGSFSGTNNLNTFTSSTGSIFVTFITNGSITDQGFDAFYTSSTSTAGCSGATTLNAATGSFSDGSMTNNYNNNQFCTWLIQPPSGTITLSFSAFATEASSDRVLVFDGIDNTAPQIGNFSGSSIPANLTSSSNSMYVEFRTNGTVTDAGWDASYTSSGACSGITNLTAAVGNIDDGSGTANYQNNANCTWLIQPAGTPASITFNMNSISLGDIQDRVRVYDGTSVAGTLIGNFFLNNTGSPAIAYSGSMFVEFTSNATNTGAGWDASYSSSNTFCSPNTTLQAASGTFTDGSQVSSNYLDNSDCNWLIQPTGLVNRVISLRFNRFATELNNDTVTIYDGTTTAAPILATFSGSLTGVTTVVSTGPEMLVTFKSNGTATATGWNAIYNNIATPSCSGNTTLTTASGTFDDGSATTSNYSDNLNCSWLIQPPSAGRITLDFNRFNTEGGFDFVTVYDGSNSSASVLGIFSGNSIPSQVVSSGTSLFAVFTSDGNTNFTGWEASYNSITSQCFPLISLINTTGNVADGSNANNYQDNLSCSWLIEPARAASVTATFNTLNINSSGDTLYFYDGINNSAALITKVTGNTIPAAVTASTGKMFVEFITNGTLNGTGWDFDYTSVIPASCSGLTTLTAASGTIEDGSLTNNYDNNLNCTWLIQPPGTPAVINFDMTTLNLSNAGGFTNRDRVRIYDGTNNTATLLRQYTGNFIGNTVSAFSGSMFIEFITNTTGTDRGWEGTYNSSSTFCVPLTTYTNANGNFSDGSPFGQNYLDNTDCSWLIQPAAPNVAINIQFFQFATEANNDTVTVYDGATTSDPILATISGNNPTIPALLSSGGDMLVTFKTNGSTTATGWRANYGTQAIPACNGTTTLTTTSGTFDDGTNSTTNYAPNLNCSWLVQSAGARLITLSFNRFDTQNNGDFVSVYDGINSSAPLLGTYSGNTVPSSINSSGNSLFVEFTSNGFFELTGWEASYVSTNVQCFSNRSVTNYSGNIDDGSGSINYQDNLGCSWLIEPPLATSITATFNTFNVSNLGDTLFIYDGNSSASPRLAAYTGAVVPAAVTSTGNQMFVEFITDGSTNNTGWDFDYTTTVSVSCAGTTNLTAPSATFDDGSFLSGNYDNNLSCEWLIQPTGSPATISFNLNRISLANFGDRIRVFDNASGSGFPIGQYFGTNIGNTTTSFTGVMLVQFTTDASNVGTGWEGVYNSSSSYCQPNTTFTTNNGNFTDGSPNGQNYLDNTNCEWLIQPVAPNVAVRLNFFGFDTEAVNDTVTVYDGATSAAAILGTFSGNTAPPVVTSSGGDMLVTFKSNGSLTSTGWRAFYNTQPIPACSGTTNLTAASARFSDGSAVTANYVQNSNCSWLIAPVGALNIDLTFSRFNTQTTNDVVNVYDGNSNAASLIGTYSGTTIPPVINSTGGTLFVEFISDGFNNATGWEANYVSFNTITLDVPQDTVYINAGAGSTLGLNLSSNVSWSTIDNATWLIASPVNGSGNATVNLLTIQANIGPQRSGRLIINATLTADADTVIVIQRTSGRFLDANPDTLFFVGNAAPSQSASITSNVSWTLAPNQSWILPSPLTGSNNGNSLISVQNNTSNQKRTSFVLVTGTLGATNDTIWVVQDTSIIINIPTLSLDKMNITLAQAMGSSDVFKVNSTTSWQTTSGATWLNVINPPITTDTQTVSIIANSMNLGALPRATYVAVQDLAGTLFDTVFVFQTGVAPLLIGAPDTVLLGATTGSSGILNIGATGTWTGIEADPWFSLSQSTGTGISTINLTTNSSNSGNTQRVSYVALADAINSLTDTVIVIQDTVTAGLVTTPDTLTVGSGFGSSATFNVSTVLSWIATPSASWITATPNSGTGSGSVSATVDANPGVTDRLAYIEVSTTGGALNTDTVWIIQQGFVANLEVNPSTVNLGFATGSNETVNITSNTSWVITNPASWLSVSTTSGINDQIVTIASTSDNLTGATRTANILVDGIGAVTRSIIVNQIDGSTPTFISSKDTVFVNNVQGSTGTFSVLSNANSWTLTENTSWLLINPASGSQTQSITALVATRNIFGTTRYADIIGSSNGFSNITVVIAQKEANPIFQVAPDSILVGADSSDFTEFNISSNMPAWNISENATWLNISPENGAFTQRIKATANSRNTTGVQRSVIATISAPPLVPKTIKIVQDTVRTIGIENNDFEIGLSVYPNPSNGQVIIQFDGNKLNGNKSIIRLFNLIGEEIPIQESFSNKNKIFLNLENQASGIYFLSIELNGKKVNRKLILTK